jgi:hypothetical protein
MAATKKQMKNGLSSAIGHCSVYNNTIVRSLKVTE